MQFRQLTHPLSITFALAISLFGSPSAFAQKKPVTVKAIVPSPIPPIGALPAVSGAGAILMDFETGQILYEKNADFRRPMASTTKIMTALLLVENLQETDVVTASKFASETKESSLHLKPGEKVSTHDMLRAMMLRSANDGCVAVAERIDGTMERFVERMNRRAQELGAVNTHFTNPHGLHDPDHFTTPRDLALITRAALNQPRIAEVVCIKKCLIARSSGSLDITLRNHSKLLGKYDGMDGVKTGYTKPAGHCYVGSATRKGWKLISVTLKSNDWQADTRSLLDYGFRNFESVQVLPARDTVSTCAVQNGVVPVVSAVTQSPVKYLSKIGSKTNVERQITIYPKVAPVAAGSIVGKLDLVSEGKVLVSAPLIAQQSSALEQTSLLSLAAKKTVGMSRFGLYSVIFAVGLVSFPYGKRYFQRSGRRRVRALAKSSRNSRRRLAESVRNLNR